MRNFRGFVLLAIFLGWITTISWFALITTSAYLLSGAALQPRIGELQLAIVGVRFFGLSRAVFRYLERLASHTVTFKLLSTLRVWFYAQLEPLIPSGLEDFQSGDLLSRIMADVDVLQEFYVRVVGPTIVAVVSSLSIFWFFGRWDVQLAWAIIAFHIFIGIVLPLFTRWVSLKPATQTIQTRSSLAALAVESIQGNSEITLYGQQAQFHRKMEELLRAGSKAEKNLNLVQSFGSSVIAIGINMIAFVLLLLAVPLVNSGDMDGRILAVVVLGGIASFEAVIPLHTAYQNLERSIQAGRRIFGIVDRPKQVLSGPDRLMAGSRLSVEINNLSFSYSHRNVLNDISLSLPFGKKIALVGFSGSGKTTISNLLLRFWDFTEGEILVNGSDIRLFEGESLRDQMAYVPQETLVFNATIAENIRIGKPKATMQELEEAARKAKAHQFITALPNGYETVVGEAGAFLSGGERQRLSIARAVIRDVPLYIFDEPFNNLDQLTAASLFDALMDLVGDKSMVLISHQVTNLACMDEIIVLEDGCIVERGTEKDLIGKGGLYRQLYELENNLFDA